MIFEMLLAIAEIVISIILFPFEALPDIPPTMQDFYDNFLSFLTTGTFVVRMILGETFQVAIFTMILAAYNAKWLYKFIMWVVKKLPIGAQ